jgi:hypothetical protein
MESSYTFDSLFKIQDDNKNNKKDEKKATVSNNKINENKKTTEKSKDLNSLILEKILKVNEKAIPKNEQLLNSKRNNTNTNTYLDSNESKNTNPSVKVNNNKDNSMLISQPSIQNVVHVNNYNINNYIQQAPPQLNIQTNMIPNLESIKSQLFQVGTNSKKTQSNNPLFKKNSITLENNNFNQSINNLNTFNMNIPHSYMNNNLFANFNNQMNKFVTPDKPKLQAYEITDLDEDEKVLVEKTLKNNSMNTLKDLQICNLPDKQKYLIFLKKYSSENSGKSYRSYINRAFKSCESIDDLEKLEFHLDNLLAINLGSLYFFTKNWDIVPLPDIWNINNETLEMYRIKRNKICSINDIRLLESNKPKLVQDFNQINNQKNNIKSIKEINNEILNSKNNNQNNKLNKDSKNKNKLENKIANNKKIFYEPESMQVALSKLRNQRFSIEQNSDLIGNFRLY